MRANVTAVRSVLAACTVALAMTSGPARAQLVTFDDILPDAPQIDANRNVTFRLQAPDATSVAVVGDIRPDQSPLEMQRAASGVWTTTVESLEPNFYSYTFFVDGVRTADPANTWIKPGVSTVANMFLVPGDAVGYAMNQRVPHGQIRHVWYESSTLGMQRRMHVYTPPGYDASRRRYPVLYLIHGGGEEDSGWSTVGRAGFILDNLIEAGDAVPMIVVMPNGNLRFIAPDAAAFENPSSPAATAARTARERRFADELVTDIMPTVDMRFRVQAGAEHRALAGLSMGGAYTLEVFKQHPLEFAYYGIWSLGFFYLDGQEFAEESPALVAEPGRINERVKLVEVTAGDVDPALPGARRVAAALEANGIANEFSVGAGGHTWLVWRENLREFLPRLFR